jgi:hypothetical protein
MMEKTKLVSNFFMSLAAMAVAAAGLAAMYQFDKTNSVAYAADYYCRGNGDGTSDVRLDKHCGIDEEVANCSPAELGLTGGCECDTGSVHWVNDCASSYSGGLLGNRNVRYSECHCVKKTEKTTCTPGCANNVQTTCVNGVASTKNCDNGCASDTKECCNAHCNGNYSITCTNGKENPAVDCAADNSSCNTLTGECGSGSNSAGSLSDSGSGFKDGTGSDDGRKVGSCSKDYGADEPSPNKCHYYSCEGGELWEYKCTPGNGNKVSSCAGCFSSGAKANGAWSNWGKCQISGDGCVGTQSRVCNPSGATCLADTDDNLGSRICTVDCTAGKTCLNGKCVESNPVTAHPGSNQTDKPVGCASSIGLQPPGSYQCTIGATNSLDKCELVSKIYQWKPYKCIDLGKKEAIDYCNKYCGGIGTDISGCATLGQHCDHQGARECDCDGVYFDVCGAVWGRSGDEDPTLCKKPAATNTVTNTVDTVSKGSKCLKADGKTFAKAGDACNTSWLGACGWDGVNHCYCKDDGTFAFDNVLTKYCKKCSNFEKNTTVCSCPDVTKTDGSRVEFGGERCGSGRLLGTSFICDNPGNGMTAKLCLNGSVCSANGCGNENPTCAEFTNAVQNVINGFNNNHIYDSMPSGNGTYSKTKNGYYVSDASLFRDINILADKNVFKAVVNNYKNFPNPDKTDIACINPNTIPQCSEENRQAYHCVASPVGQGCYVWDWLTGGSKPCLNQINGKYCDYANANGTQVLTGECAKNKILSHVLTFDAAKNSLTETIKTLSNPDSCTANCFYSKGDGCDFSSSAATTGTLVSKQKINSSGNEASITYQVAKIMDKGSARFQCEAQCATGSDETSFVKSNLLSTANAQSCSNELLSWVNSQFHSGASGNPFNNYNPVTESNDLKAGVYANFNKSDMGTGNGAGTGIGTGTGTSNASGFSVPQLTAEQQKEQLIAGVSSNFCNLTDKNGTKVTGQVCATDNNKCYYPTRQQACGNGMIYCAGTASNPLYKCSNNVLMSWSITSDGTGCEYSVVKACGNQKCDSGMQACD